MAVDGSELLVGEGGQRAGVELLEHEVGGEGEDETARPELQGRGPAQGAAGLGIGEGERPAPVNCSLIPMLAGAPESREASMMLSAKAQASWVMLGRAPVTMRTALPL